MTEDPRHEARSPPRRRPHARRVRAAVRARRPRSSTALRAGKPRPLLAGKTLAMIFEKPSLRTRVSFETGMFQLGGHAHLPGAVGHPPRRARDRRRRRAQPRARGRPDRRAHVPARGRWSSSPQHARVPVINGLTDLHHPCQVLADLLTLVEHRRQPRRSARRVRRRRQQHRALVDRGRRARFRFTFALACPAGYEPDPTIVAEAARRRARSRSPTTSPTPSATPTSSTPTSGRAWDRKARRPTRRRDVRRVPGERRASCAARPRTRVVMHCLPAHRGDEITDAVIESPQSIVFDQAENRLHVQKALHGRGCVRARRMTRARRTRRTKARRRRSSSPTPAGSTPRSSCAG